MKFMYKWADYYLNEEACVILGILTCFILVVLTLGNILTPIGIAIILVYLLDKLVDISSRWVRLQVARWAVGMLFMCSVLIFMIYIAPIALEQLTSFSKDWPILLNNGKSSVLHLLTINMGLSEQQAIQVMDYSYSQIAAASNQVVASLAGGVSHIATFSVYIILVPILVLFTLPSWKDIVKKIQDKVPESYKAIQSIYIDMGIQISNYTKGKVLESALVALISYIVFICFDLKYAGTLAVMSGISVLLPIIGAFIVTVPIALIALLQWNLEYTTFYLLLAHLIIQLIDGYIVVPIIFSDSIDVHPSIIIICILVFGSVWGVWGAFLAIPIYTLLRSIVQFWPVIIKRDGS